MNTYISNIESAFLFFPLILFLTFLPVILYQYKKHGYAHGKRNIFIYLFILFLITAYFMVILPLPKIVPNFCELRAGNTHISLEFFRFLREMVAEAGTWSIIPILKTKTFLVTFFNILLLLPLGFFLRYLYKMKWLKVLLISFSTSLFFEISQLSGLFGIYPCPYRLFEVDDLITNTSGAMLGFFLFKYLKFLPSLEMQKIKFSKVANRTQIFLLYVFDIIIFWILTSILVEFFPIDYETQNIPNVIFQISTFLIYYVFIPSTSFGTTIMGKILSLRLIKKEKIANWKVNLIYYGTMFLLPSTIFKILFNLIETEYNNGVYAVILILIAILWFYFVFLKKLFGKRKGLQEILSGGEINYFDKNK